MTDIDEAFARGEDFDGLMVGLNVERDDQPAQLHVFLTAQDPNGDDPISGGILIVAMMDRELNTISLSLEGYVDGARRTLTILEDPDGALVTLPLA